MSTPSTLYVGLDNGTSGAIAFLFPDGRARVQLTPSFVWGPDHVINDLELRKRILAALEECPAGTRLRVCFEKTQKNPKWGAKTNFLQGDGGAVMRTVVRQNGWKGSAVNPKDWQKDLFPHVPDAGADTKAKSIAYCKKFFPGTNLIPPNARKEHDGMADALCIAAWALLREL